jgi:hypothetical protein
MLSRSATELPTVRISLEDAMPASCLSNLGKRAFFVVLMVEWSCRVDPRKLVKAARTDHDVLH